MLEIVRKAADRLGGVPKLAERIGVTRQAIYQWRDVPADRVGQIAQLTGLTLADLRPDIFGPFDLEDVWRQDAVDDRVSEPDFAALRADRLAWIEAQIDAIAAKSLSAIDTDRLIDLLQSLADEARRDIDRRLGVILVRWLKWHYRANRRSLSTIGVITAEKARVLARLAASTSLRHHAEQSLEAIYQVARQQASDETGLALDIFPANCPIGLADLLEPAFAPSANLA